MTHLETLVRILPRQRRALEAQKNVAIGMFWAGYIVSSLAVISLASFHPAGVWFGLTVTGLLLGGSWLLWGGYRLASTEIQLAKIAAELDAVLEALEEEARARRGLGDHTVALRANTNQVVSEIRRAVAEDLARDKQRHRA
jgi:hypothetical protein